MHHYIEQLIEDIEKAKNRPSRQGWSCRQSLNLFVV